LSREKPPELSDDDVRAISCYRSLVRATLSIKGSLSRQVRKFKLSEAQFGMLELLYREGTMTQKEIAGELGVSYGEITHLVEKLREKKMAARRRRAIDRRFIVIGITSFGRWYMEYAEPSAVKIIADGMKLLAAEEQEELMRLCKKVEEGEKDEG